MKLFARAFAAIALVVAAGSASAQQAVDPATESNPFAPVGIVVDSFRATDGSIDQGAIGTWMSGHSETDIQYVRNTCILERGSATTIADPSVLAFCDSFMVRLWQPYITGAYAASVLIVLGFLAFAIVSNRRVKLRLKELEARGVRRRSDPGSGPAMMAPGAPS